MDRALEIAVARAGGRMMHDENQGEVVCFRPDDLARFAREAQLRTLHAYSVLVADANAVGLTLTSNQLQFLLREHKGSQVYASCPDLEAVDEALRGRRQQMNAPGGQTRPLQGVLTSWGRPDRRGGDVWDQTFDAGHGS